MLAASTNVAGCGHFVHSDEVDGDEHAFQKFSRMLWRAERGQVRALPGIPAGCALLHWDCLALSPPDAATSCTEWLAGLQREHGIPAYWVRDTYVGRFTAAALAAPQLP